ncbi:hypothetical protein DFQ27_007876, partial [Actinomortierella ambigua]
MSNINAINARIVRCEKWISTLQGVISSNKDPIGVLSPGSSEGEDDEDYVRMEREQLRQAKIESSAALLGHWQSELTVAT